MSVIHLWRRERGTKTAFVLGGGGNLGAVQVGMLAAVLEQGVTPDLLVGCSVGALHAAVLAAQPRLAEARRLEDIWLRLDGEDLLPSGHLSPLRLLARRRPSLDTGEGLRRLIDRCNALATFEEASVPFEVVATSADTGRERWFARGSVRDALLASCALPAVFPPVEIDGERYIDGGVVNNVPISRALALGAHRIWVFHVGNFPRPRSDFRRPVDVLLQAFSISRSHRFAADVESVPASVELVVPPGVDPGGIRYNDFGHTRELIDRGYESTVAYLAERGEAAG